MTAWIIGSVFFFLLADYYNNCVWYKSTTDSNSNSHYNYQQLTTRATFNKTQQKVEENKKQNKTQTTSSIGQQIGVIRKLLKNFRNTQQKKTTKKKYKLKWIEKKRIALKTKQSVCYKKIHNNSKKKLTISCHHQHH